MKPAFSRLLQTFALLLLSVGSCLAGSDQPGSANKVLVFGGTGQLGAAIVGELVAAGYPVTVFVRPSSDRHRLAGLKVSYVTGDILNAAQVAAAFAGKDIRTVVDATARGSADDEFYPTAMAHIIAGAKAGGVQQIILEGSVGAGDNIKQFPQANFGRMSSTLAAKGRAEQLLIDSGIGYTIIRNGILLSADLPPTRTARLSTDQSLMRKVTRTDLGILTALCVGNPDYMNGIWHAVDDSQDVPPQYR
jgi:nucleoside-diphosphate-sugar epimerase